MLKTISYSALHLLACPYASFLHYQAGIRGATTPWMASGNAIHFAIEKGHEGNSFSIKSAHNSFLKEFTRILDEEEVFISWPQTKKMEAEAFEMLEKYNEQISASIIPAKPLELEKAFRIPYLGIEVVGRIDKIDKSDTGGYIVTDFKTGKNKPDEWFLKHNLQFTAYAWACLLLYGELPEKVVWHHLRTGDFLEGTRSDIDIEQLKVMIRNAILFSKEGVRHRIFHEQVCGQCEYSGFPQQGWVRPANPVCDDLELEKTVVERLGLNA